MVKAKKAKKAKNDAVTLFESAMDKYEKSSFIPYRGSPENMDNATGGKAVMLSMLSSGQEIAMTYSADEDPKLYMVINNKWFEIVDSGQAAE